MSTMAELLTRAQEYLDNIEAEGRDLTDDEQRVHDGMLATITRRQKVEHMTRVGTHTEGPDGIRRIGEPPPARDVARRTDDSPGGQLRDEARQTIDRNHSSGLLPDHAAVKAERLVTAGPAREQSIAARWAVAAGDENYRGAFAKLLADPNKGHLLWSPEEHRSYQAADQVRTAMSLTAGNGGYMVPLSMDPAILLSNDGSRNPIRNVARVVQTVTNSWTGITSAGATSEWKAEGVEAADGSPTIGNPVIPVFLGDSYVPYSFEIGQDAANFLEELTKVLVDSADNLMATAYTTGSGSGQPQGFITGLAGTASEINTTHTEALTTGSDAYVLQNALGPRFQPNASWLANIAIINTFAQFETTNGGLKFPEIANDRLLRKPLHEVSNMDGAINAAATANNYVLAYGDWRQAFCIVDRIGSQLELIPHVVGTNHRPTGQRGALLWFRTGSEIVVPEAARLLDVPTTA